MKAQIALRDLVLDGGLGAGERVSELQMVERLGVSRTPVRAALARLAEEGLLEAIPSGGYAVRSFSQAEVFAAVEIRGTLEGLAARLAAERGADPSGLSGGLDDIDGLLQRDLQSIEDVSRYVELNAGFHAGLLRLAGSDALERQMQRLLRLPFASPSALVRMQSQSPEPHRMLTVAQDQHRCVVEAITRREGGRAEAIMREHARLAHRNLERAFRDKQFMGMVPGAALIRLRPGVHVGTTAARATQS